jgi:hypothetical protein
MGDRAGRWFHTLVVVGTAMTACGGSTTVDARPGHDAGRTGAQPGVGGADAGGAEGGASAGTDASPTADASAAPDAAAIIAACCGPGPRCKLDDAGAPVCGFSTCCEYCGCIQ